MDPSFLLNVFVVRLPLFLMFIGVIVFALVRWKRHPAVSFLTIMGLLLYLLEAIFFTFLIFLMPRVLPAGLTHAATDSLYLGLFLLDDLVYAAVIIVLVSAVFTQRKREPAPSL